MTSLYRLDTNAAAIAETFGAVSGDDPWLGGCIVPVSFAPVITAGREFIAGSAPQRGPIRMTPRLWGVPPPPNVSDPARAIMSVRNPDSPFWIGNLRNYEFRCLIPATAFMEWGSAIDVEGRKLQHWFVPSGQRVEQSLFAFAGVWKDSEVPGFAIMTCPANSALRAIGQSRMPVVLPADRSAYETWLYGNWKDAGLLLKPAPPESLQEIDAPQNRPR